MTGQSSPEEERREMTPMQKVDLLRAACCIAGIDGDLEGPERDIINRLASDVGVGKASLDAMIARGKRDPEFHKEQFRVLKADPQHSMAVLLEVALADGRVSDRESVVLESLSQRLEVPPDVFQQLMSNVRNLEKNDE